MSFFQKMWNKVSDNDIDIIRIKKHHRILWLLVVCIILAGIVTIDFLPNQVNLEVGQVSRVDIEAPKTVKYIDQERTEELKEEAKDSVSKVYEEDVTVLGDIRREVNKFFDQVVRLQNKDEELDIRVKELMTNNKIELNLEEAEYLLKLTAEDIENLKEDILMIFAKYLNRGVKNDYLIKVKEQLNQEAFNLKGDRKYRQLVDRVTRQLIKPNLMFNLEETMRRKEQAIEKIEPVQRTIHKGEIVIRHGKLVTEDDIKILEALGLRHQQVKYSSILGHILLVFIFIGSIVIYIIQYQREILETEGVMALLGLLPIIILLFAKIANYFPLLYPSFVVPVAACSIIIAILIETNLAIIFTISLSFLVGIITGNAVVNVAVAVISGLTGIYSVSKLSQRSDLVWAGFIVGGASALTIFSFLLTMQQVEWIQFLKIVPLGIINGVLVAIVTNGLLPYIENIFGITSPVKLLELSNPNHSLLKRLLVEAPGTYHHSIIVGNLAESAADKVGADSLLARVGAYYHDIGKVKRSYFFTENQIGDENPHNKLSPNLSTLIITSHIKDGVELAKEHKLPRVIIDIIEQHHGTSLVSFFYQEAVYDEKYKNVDEDDFRYQGPKPQTKEAALIMLADVVEAAVRSNASAQSNPGKLEKLVRDLIKSKLDSGQLDESDLTLKDLDKVATSFVNILKGIFHSRIEYPENIAQQFKEGKN